MICNFRFFLDKRRKIGYCQIPKAACSTLKSVMAQHTKAGRNYSIKELGANDFIHSFIQRTGDIKKVRNHKARPGNYTLFMSLRNPFDRLVSAYYNKAFPWRRFNGKMQIYYIPIRNWVLNKFQHRGLTSYQKEWYNATFEEFIAFTLSVNDEHWNSLEKFCEPCRLDYKYILRVETMERDSQVLMGDLYPDSGQLPFTNAKRQKNISASFQSVIPKTLHVYSQLSRKTLKKLMKKYAFDLQFYGYSFNTKTFQANCNFKDHNCC